MDLCTGLYRLDIPNNRSCTYFDHLGTILIIFDLNFGYYFDQKHVTTHTLEMITTLARFRDPIWCMQSQLNARICLWEPYWCRRESVTILGTLFVNSEFSRWFGIMIDFVLFVCQHTMKWTLTLLVCWYIYYEGLPIGRTWRLYLNFWCNGCRFDEHLGNI